MMTDTATERNMTGTIKPFDAQLHAVTDKKGKLAFLSWLSNHATKNIENPDQYGIDILSLDNKNRVVHAWEIEVRVKNWMYDRPFPYKTINCLERKEYLWRKGPEFKAKIPFEIHDECKVSYVQLNKDCTRAVIVPGVVILDYPKVRTTNRFNTVEYVRQVPAVKAAHIRIGG
jgi:hypothetical protein